MASCVQEPASFFKHGVGKDMLGGEIRISNRKPHVGITNFIHHEIAPCWDNQLYPP